MIAGDGRAALAAAFYAAHHVLVKGALFLSIGVIAATGSRHLWPTLLPAAIIAVGLGGLPFTGGALAKIVADGLLGDSTASTIATLSAVGTTLLMLQFLRSLARYRVTRPASNSGRRTCLALAGDRCRFARRAVDPVPDGPERDAA